ncbi:MAG: hypothetical protein WBN28_12445 [Lutimonas sp.]
MTKKLLLSLASLFLAYRSVELLKFLDIVDPTQFTWIGVIAFSFALNLFITGVFALLGFAFLTSRILPNSYYKIKNPEKLSFMYKILGVEHFKFLLLKFFWGKERNRKKYFNGTKNGLENFETQTRQSEFGHLTSFIAILIVSIYILFKGYVVIFCITNLINIIGNLYPIILQRNHRIQIARLKLILEKRKLNI